MYPIYQLSRAFKFKNRTSGDITLNSTSWADVDNDLDIMLAAVEGDVIEVGLQAKSDSEAVAASLDVASIVSASPVNYWSGGGGASDEGVPSWYCSPSVMQGHGGSMVRTLLAGDIADGYVLLRLRYRTSSATDKTLLATTVSPFQFWGKNLGPEDPH